MVKAFWNNQLIAESNNTKVIEGNHYFPADSINSSFFSESNTETFCPWKGTAHYKNITVNGQENKDAAWYYANPKEKAKEIKDHFAFWKGVEIKID